ncbi:MAG: GxxExxY protein [Gemmatimonadales bacterium]
MERGLGRFDGELLTEAIIGAAMEAHSVMGPGLLETAYQDALCYELGQAALPFERQPLVGNTYKTIRIDRAFRPDVIVKNEVILVLKSVEKLHHIHDAQLQTYLKITGLKTGLIFNFNTKFLKNGIRRIDLPGAVVP